MWRREPLQVASRSRSRSFILAEVVTAGEADSHSLYFELSHGWTGLLVEPGVTGLELKNRRATVSPSCLATQPRPHYVHYAQSTALLGSEGNIEAMGGIVEVERWRVREISES